MSSNRDRLIELFQKAEDICDRTLDCDTCKYILSGSCKTVLIADHLLANGVIVPPCKVGDKVYITASISKEIVESVVIGMWIIEDSFSILTIHGTIISDSLGKTVFLTKEGAEEKIKEREG